MRFFKRVDTRGLTVTHFLWTTLPVFLDNLSPANLVKSFWVDSNQASEKHNSVRLEFEKKNTVAYSGFTLILFLFRWHFILRVFYMISNNITSSLCIHCCEIYLLEKRTSLTFVQIQVYRQPHLGTVGWRCSTLKTKQQAPSQMLFGCPHVWLDPRGWSSSVLRGG